MSDARNDGYRTSGDGSRHALVAKRHEVLVRAPSTHEQHHLRACPRNSIQTLDDGHSSLHALDWNASTPEAPEASGDAGWTFTGWTRAWMMFGGLPVSLSIPWGVILQGVGFAFALCIAMAVPPILWLVRKQDGTGGLTVQ